LGADFGYTGVRPADGLLESDRDGAALHVKALFSKYTQDWVGDLGLGYSYHWAQGDDQFSPLRGSKVKVVTRAGFIEFSPRYRLSQRSQAGLVANGFFGNDVGFDESRVSNVKFALAAGIRYNFETEGEVNRKRYGIQMMRDVTVPNRGIWWIMADFQFGIPSFFGGEPKESSVPIAAPATVVVETPKRPSAPRFAEVTPEKAVKIYLGEAVLRFKTASSELRPSSKSILETVSQYLKKAPDSWQKMRVDGHADKRGSVEYNNKLSLARANRVRSELIKLGIPKAKLTAQGYGPSRPIDPEEDLEAYALNRRVELWLDGVTDPETLVRDLNELK
jgi:outer membrane protein OmpA-like peptidoglycan-associated protein